MFWLAWQLLGLVIVAIGLLAAWLIVGGITESLRERRFGGFLFWLAVGFGFVSLVLWLLSLRH